MNQPLTDGSKTDLLILGGGPAGCAAAVMAASLGMRSVIVEPNALCHTLHRIPATDNVLGYSSGPSYANAISADVARSGLCQPLIGERAVHLDAEDHHVTATLDSGRQISASFAIVATGVRPLTPDEVSWVTVEDAIAAPPLWEANPKDLGNRTIVVLGADRPLGTLLRSHPDLAVEIIVLHPEEDDYKADEARTDPRVTLKKVQHVRISAHDGKTAILATLLDGTTTQLPSTERVFSNLGVGPAPLGGALQQLPTGYSAAQQHQRILAAGDIRSPRGQRIATATGSGAEAALHAYYALRLGPAGR